MNILELFQTKFSEIIPTVAADFNLVDYKESCYIGTDNYNNCVLVVKSPTPTAQCTQYRTKVLSIECNANVEFLLNGKSVRDSVHILKCFSKHTEDRKLFLELAAIFVEDSDYSEENFTNIFQMLSNFFSMTGEISESELRGLYTELLTITDYANEFCLAPYWHTKSTMKFDFSLTEKLKIEVKSTVRSERIHHFNNEQLDSSYYDTYIISYMLREDDTGLSLFDLINTCKPLCRDKGQLSLLEWYSLKVPEQRLRDLKFDQNYSASKRRIFRANNIPHISAHTTPSLSNINFDCILDETKAIESAEFLEHLKSSRQSKSVNYYNLNLE